jgi:hypothetical protein
VTEGLRGGTDSARPPLLFAHGADGIEAAVLDAQDLPRHPATSWDDGQAALEIAVPLGDQTLPGLLLDDPDDPTEGLDTLVLSPTRRRVDGVTLKSAPAGHGEWAFATVGLPTDRGPVFVHFRLFLLSPDGRELLLWHSSGARTIASQRLVESVARGEEGLLPGASHRLYAEGRLGATLWNGGDGTAERRYVDTIRLAVRQQSRMAAFALERTRWGLVVLRLPFPAEPLRLWAGRLDPSRPGHDAALAARLRPFLDDVLLLTDSWVGEIARRVPADAALVVIGDRGLEGADRVLRPNVALADAGLLRVSDSGAIDLAHTKVVYAPTNGGFLVLNRDSRPGGIQPRRGESLVQASAIRAMKALADQSAGDPPIAALFTPDERAAPPGVGGPSGGFLYLRPAPGVALSSEARGPLVETIETRGESFDPARSSAAGMIILAGSGVTGGRRLPDVAAVDVAPTLSRLLGLLPPPQAQGRPLSQALSPAP